MECRRQTFAIGSRAIDAFISVIAEAPQHLQPELTHTAFAAIATLVIESSPRPDLVCATIKIILDQAVERCGRVSSTQHPAHLA